MLSGGNPVGIDGLNLSRIRIAMPAHHESLCDSCALVDDPLWDGGLVNSAGGLCDVGQRHHRCASQLVARRLVIDIQQRRVTPDRREHGQAGLNVHPNVTGMDRQREWFSRGQSVTEPAVDQQAPDVPEGHLVADELFDIDAAVAQCPAVFVGFGDFGGECHHAFEAGYEAFWNRAHSRNCSTGTGEPYGGAVGINSERDRLAAMRVEYGAAEKDGSADLDVDWLADGWVALLHNWIEDAAKIGLAEPNAMVLATVDAGRPVSRTVLCKSVDESGVTFYTNYDSAKGAELLATPYAAVTFPWYGLGRQVHVRGPVAKVDATETAQYWSRRPRGSQLGAWASRQSQPVASRAELLTQLGEVTSRFADGEVPVPPHWGGYRITPEVVEFWQGREDRIHNRIRVTPADGRIVRLQP